jgi:hypothetical protein
MTKRNGHHEQGIHNGDTGEHDPQELLGIYLDDHWAGAGAGTSLANRLATENEGTQWYADLRRIADEIEQDQRALRRVREACAGGGFSVKRLMAQGAERVGRLKTNGSLIGYSPLSRVLELEALISGVKAKRLLWQSLRHTDAAAHVDLDQMESRTKAQLETLVAIHEQAATIAFTAHEPALGV